jgi:GTPase SAR1 family protein/RNase P subunit RPR2
VWSVVALPDGRRALSGGWDRVLRVWDIDTGECLKCIETGDQDIFCTAIGRDGGVAVTGHRDGNLKLFDLETSECLGTLQGHGGIVRSVAVIPDIRYAVSGAEDKTLKIWDLMTATCVGTLEGHKGNILSVAISPDNALIASAGFTDKTVRLWDAESGACVHVVEVQADDVPASVAFSPTGRHLLVGLTGSGLYVYRLSGVKAAVPAVTSRRYTNAKVVLLGESGVGKSGLAHRLIEDEFVATESTHGMKVWRLDLPLDNKDGTEREALLWDLAGQEDYRLIHQLFLDETALALMLINPQKDDPFAEVGDWLKALRVAVSGKDAGREVAKLLVAARTDVGAVKISQQKIDRFMKEHGFADYVATSAARGDNCSDKGNGGQPSELKRLIASHIKWDALPWTSTPKLLADVKNAVLDMAEKKEIRLLRFAELSQRLEQALTGQSIGESDARTAVMLLANHGLVMPLKFGDLVLLRPELMNGYAGAVIRAARAHTDEIGSVCERDVYGEGFDFSGVERLERPDEELLLRAMVQTFLDKSLCIAEDTSDGRQLIFPSQYRRERPIPAYPEIFVSYNFAGELQTIYTTLVVRMWYSRQFEQKELWRNAAEFVTTTGRTVGLVMERVGEGLGTVSVFFEPGVPDELKVVFIEFVHRHLERYARDVRRDRRYVCPKCSKPVTDYDAVRERLEAGKNFIVCQKCDKKVPLIDHIEQRLGTDPVARKVRDMEERDRRGRDAQALEQILIGHMMAVCGEANQIFRQVNMPEYGIDGEVEFKDKDGHPSGKKIYVRLKSDNSNMIRARGDADGYRAYVFDDEPGMDSWAGLPADVYLVIRNSEGTILWMNATRYLKEQKRKSRQILFEGERLDAPAVWRVRDEYFPRPVVS